MTRKEAIEVIRKNWPDASFTQLREALETLIPELAESEDERIRKDIIAFLQSMNSHCDPAQDWDLRNRWLPYLEKQKELFESGRGLYYYDGEKTIYCGYPATEENPYDFAMSQQEKQKAQKPEHFELKAGKWYFCHRAFCCRADHLTVKEGERFVCEKDGVVKGFVIKEPEKYFIECSAPAPMEDEQEEQKPAKWSEADEKTIDEAVEYVEKSVEYVQGGFSKHYVLSLARRLDDLKLT